MAINRKSIITTLFIWAVTAVAAQNSIEIVVHRGANAPGLQSLIDEVSLKGGGRIVFPKGEYPTGQLELKSGVELHLEEGAVILGSTSPYDYHQVDTRPTAGDERNDKSQLGLIVAKNAHHIAITGKGTIDGQGLELALTIDSLHHKGELVDAHALPLSSTTQSKLS